MKETLKENREVTIAISGLLIFAPQVIALFLGFVYLFKTKKDNLKVLILSLSTLVLLSVLFPVYAVGAIEDYAEVVTNFFNTVGKGNLLLFVLSIPFRYRIVSNMFFVHAVFTLALILKYVVKKDVKIENLDEALGDILNKEAYVKGVSPLTEQNLPNKTVIGMKTKTKVVATNDDARHVFICGTTGSGKTIALSNYIESAIRKGYPALIVDGKGDIGEGSIFDIVKKLNTGRKVYVVNMTNPQDSCKYNPFKDANATIAKDMLVNLTYWSEEHYKANTERYIQRVLWLLQKTSKELSFKTLLSSMTVEGISSLVATCYKSKLIDKIEYTETMDIMKVCSTIALEASARFVTIAESEIGSIFDESGVDIYTALKEKAIVLFVLNPLLYPELSTLFGRLILIDAKKAVSKLFHEKEERVFYIFDEINTYASTIFIDLVNKSRSANITCIAATQSLSDLDFVAGEAFREQIIENCNNYIVMRQNSAKNAESWAKILGTTEGVAVTYQIGEKKSEMASTGLGTVKKERQFLYHPDDIKRLSTGEAVYMSKDTGEHTRLHIRKGF